MLQVQLFGQNTRKYHGLLFASMGESGNRYLVLSKINESIVVGNKTYTISTNQCNDFIEDGYIYQEFFRRAFLPEFQYKVGDIEINKKIAMKYGENKIAIVYKIRPGNNDITFRLQPLVNYRSFHTTRNCYNLEYDSNDTTVNVKLNSHKDTLHMKTSSGYFEQYDRTYFRNMFYNIEKERGFGAYEDHFMPGGFVVNIPKNKEYIFEFIACVDKNNSFEDKVNASDIVLSESTRYEKICKIAEANTLTEKHLVVSADNFIVKRGNRKTIIAGYPWFGDWGRDTFIAFEGILLKTNRYIDAKEIILSFIPYIKHGLIPNLIDENGAGAYNTADASLWYIDAIYKYYKYTNDLRFIEQTYPIILNIIDSYKKGTDYDIKMDPEDGLIFAGNNETQLTWMDAKVNGYIPTPRNGKVVEINALWYNALKIVEEFSDLLGEDFSPDLSAKVKVSFEKFYTDFGLLDVIEPTDYKIRPNQIIALGLEYSPLDDKKAKEVLMIIEEKLYTNKGLKTLSSNAEEYKPYYEGDSFSRDASYHQGTVWPWLLQFYFNASKKYTGKYCFLEDIEEMIQDNCIGSICEIYDAEEPRKAKGAPSQAWSVAMALLNI